MFEGLTAEQLIAKLQTCNKDSIVCIGELAQIEEVHVIGVQENCLVVDLLTSNCLYTEDEVAKLEQKIDRLESEETGGNDAD